jgi:transposase-like protein
VAGRATYEETHKAHVYVVLTANDGNVKRTARETGIPENTVRGWKNDFATNGPPGEEVVEHALEDFTVSADKVRTLGLEVLRRKLELLKKDPKTVNVGQVSTMIGILTDKVDRARGLDVRRVEHQHHLPSPEEARALVMAFAENLRESAIAREAEIVDAEIVEQPALPAGR